MAWAQVSQVGRFPIYHSHVLEKCANHAAGFKLLSVLLGKAVSLCIKKKKRPSSFIKQMKEQPKKKHDIVAH